MCKAFAKGRNRTTQNWGGFSNSSRCTVKVLILNLPSLLFGVRQQEHLSQRLEVVGKGVVKRLARHNLGAFPSTLLHTRRGRAAGPVKISFKFWERRPRPERELPNFHHQNCLRIRILYCRCRIAML